MGGVINKRGAFGQEFVVSSTSKKLADLRQKDAKMADALFFHCKYG